MKIKMMNGNPCLASMNSSNNCFDTLSFLNGDGHFQVDPTAYATSGDAAAAATSYTLPAPMAATYRPYPMDGTLHKLTLIVKDLEARLFWTDTDGTVVGTVAQLPDTYTGGKIGLFTYAHQVVFDTLTITDLDPATASGMPTGYCGGTAACLATGVCGDYYAPSAPPSAACFVDDGATCAAPVLCTAPATLG